MSRINLFDLPVASTRLTLVFSAVANHKKIKLRRIIIFIRLYYQTADPIGLCSPEMAILNMNGTRLNCIRTSDRDQVKLLSENDAA